MVPRPLIAISSVRPFAACSAASGSAASSTRTETLSERISAAVSRSAPRNTAPVAPGSEPEVSTMTAIAVMLCEWIEGSLGAPSWKAGLMNAAMAQGILPL